jgi:hypothetical protein
VIVNSDLQLLIRHLAATEPNVKLLNVYKGLPISYDASISSVGDTEIRVHSNRFQLACLYYQRETYLQGNEFPFLLRSQVTSLDLGHQDATLTSLEVADKGIGERAQIRVEPDESLIARIKFDGSAMEFIAPLADISAEGASALFEYYVFPMRLCRPDNSVLMTLSLPDSVTQKLKKLATKPLPLHPEAWRAQTNAVVITTLGKVISVRAEQDMNRYRVGMRLFFKDLSRTVILQYISQRQSEIIRDLGVLTDELYSLKK